MSRYVIITPAHNEEGFLEATIQSVINQTIPPRKWVIVDDCSQDRTAEIVSRYKLSCEFIELIRCEREQGRHFGNKVMAFRRGLLEMLNVDYEFVGNLDADIKLDKNYYEMILQEFDKDGRLGIAGGMVYSYCKGRFISHEVSLDSVGGQVQLFRRRCYEAIGGYIPLPHGGIDAAAEIIARMNGWKVRTFPEYRVFERRETGWAAGGQLAARRREGHRLYLLGYSFLFFFLRCIFRCKDRPRVLGSAAALSGYLSGLLKREPYVLRPDVVRYLRAEQRGKLLKRLGFRCGSLESA
jgi:biofilm PGA synthesis N-glycosyltransferase PgaC